MFLWLSLVVMLGAFLRFYDLDGESLWMDEAFSWLWIHHGQDALWGAAGRWEANPPLYYSIQRPWTQVFGDSEAGLRSFSAVVGTLTVPIVFLLGRLIWGAVAGLIAALLLATAPLHIAYSQEARAYALVMLAATMAVWGLLRFLSSHGGLAAAPGPSDRRGRGLGLAAYAAGTTIALYGHNTAVFLPVFANAIALCWWIGRMRLDRRFALEWLAANFVTLILWLWWLPIVLTQTQTTLNIAWIEQPSILTAIFQVVRLYGNRYVPTGQPWSALIPVVPLLGVLAVWRWRDRWPAVAALLVFVVGVPAMIWLFGLIVRPIWIERTILWPLGLGMVLAAGGVLAIRPRAARLAVLGLLLAIQCANVVAYYRLTLKPRWDQVAGDIAAAIAPTDVILYFPHFAKWPFTYYAEPLGVAARQIGIYQDIKPPFDVLGRTLGQAMDYADWRKAGALARRGARAWVIFRNRVAEDPHDLVLEQLRQVGTVTPYGSYPPRVEVFLVTFEPPRGEGADARTVEPRSPGAPTVPPLLPQ